MYRLQGWGITIKNFAVWLKYVKVIEMEISVEMCACYPIRYVVSASSLASTQSLYQTIQTLVMIKNITKHNSLQLIFFQGSLIQSIMVNA